MKIENVLLTALEYFSIYWYLYVSLWSEQPFFYAAAFGYLARIFFMELYVICPTLPWLYWQNSFQHEIHVYRYIAYIGWALSRQDKVQPLRLNILFFDLRLRDPRNVHNISLTSLHYNPQSCNCQLTYSTYL